MKNKKIIATLLLTLLGATVLADTDKKIVIETASGTSSYLLSEVRSVKFNNGIMLLNMHNGSTANWDTNSVSRVIFSGEFSEAATSLGNIAASRTFEISGKSIIVNTVSLKPILLFTANGEIVHCSQCCGEMTIDLSQLPNGIYILNINGNAYKIINR